MTVSNNIIQGRLKKFNWVFLILAKNKPENLQKKGQPFKEMTKMKKSNQKSTGKFEPVDRIGTSFFWQIIRTLLPGALPSGAMTKRLPRCDQLFFEQWREKGREYAKDIFPPQSYRV